MEVLIDLFGRPFLMDVLLYQTIMAATLLGAIIAFGYGLHRAAEYRKAQARTLLCCVQQADHIESRNPALRGAGENKTRS